MQKGLNDEMIRLNSEWEKVRSSEQLIVGENEVADIVWLVGLKPQLGKA